MTTTTPVVDYGTPATRPSRWDVALVRIALACALLPMSAGLLVTAAWLVTGFRALESIGLLILIGGVPLFCVGMACCLIATIQDIAAKRHGRAWMPRTAAAATLLAANIPLALGCMHVGSLSRIRVVNNSPAIVTSCVVTDPRGYTWQFGPIAPREASTRWMHFHGKGAVSYTATTNLAAGPVNSGGTITTFVPFGAGERYTITIHADGTSTPLP